MLPKSTSGIGLITMIVALVALVVRGSFFGESPIPIAVQVAAVLLMLWARRTFGWRSFHATASPTEGGLVTSGPYGFLRHPIYAAALYITWAGVLSHLDPFNVILGVLAIVGAVMRMLSEEKLLVERYPDYIEYAKRTKRIVPFVV